MSNYNDEKPKNDWQDDMQSRTQEWAEEIRVNGRDAVNKVKELMQEGDIRRVIVRKKNGDKLVEFPLTPGVVVSSAMLVFAPTFAALGALAAFLAEVRIEIIRDNDLTDDDDDSEAPTTTVRTKHKIDVE